MPSNNIYTSETKETIRPTRLYIKQHSITGLKYFGKTTCVDPYKYLGSGARWLNHINKHGTEFVETLWVSEPYTDTKLIKEAALKFSIENNIVESAEWANLRPENGLEGGLNHWHGTEKQRAISIKTGLMFRDTGIGIFGMTGEQKRQRLSKIQQTILEKYGVKSIFSILSKDPKFLAKRKESLAKINHQQGKKNSQFGTIWITDGTITRKIKKDDPIPDGWRKGRNYNLVTKKVKSSF